MFKKLLVPLDRSTLAEQALGQAAAIARAAHADVEVVLVHSPLPFGAFSDAPWSEGEWNAEHSYLQTITAELESGAGVPVTHAMMRGGAAELICSRAEAIGADLIVMSSHGRTGFSRAWLGSVTDGVVRRSQIPVLILRPVEKSRPRLAAPHSFKRVLVPLDNSALAFEAIGPAADLAEASGAELVLLHVVPPVPMITAYESAFPITFAPMVVDETLTAGVAADSKRHLEEVATRLRAERRLAVVVEVVVDSRIADGILGFAHGHSIDVIAMTTHGRGASRLLLGSIADKVVRGSRVPVMLRRPIDVGEPAAEIRDADIVEDMPALSGL